MMGARKRVCIAGMIMPHASRPCIARALVMLRGKTVEMPARNMTTCRVAGLIVATRFYPIRGNLYLRFDLGVLA